jgi:hypothetical protein
LASDVFHNAVALLAVDERAQRAIAKATTTTILSDTFSFASRQPRLLSSATQRPLARIVAGLDAEVRVQQVDYRKVCAGFTV